jgi:hypothetical protein
VRKIIPFFIIWIFLTGSGGYFFFFKFQQVLNFNAIQERLLKQAKQSKLDVLIFDAGKEIGVKWVKKRKEFIYQNKIYDIVSIKFSGKHVLYYCFDDKKEKKLITDFENKNHKNNQTNQIFKRISYSQFIIPAPLYKSFRMIVACRYFQPFCHYLSPVSSTISPPPKADQIS